MPNRPRMQRLHQLVSFPPRCEVSACLVLRAGARSGLATSERVLASQSGRATGRTVWAFHETKDCAMHRPGCARYRTRLDALGGPGTEMLRGIVTRSATFRHMLPSDRHQLTPPLELQHSQLQGCWLPPLGMQSGAMGTDG
jgi:hypothetical protein